MRDELKYPRAFALMPVRRYYSRDYYISNYCYIVSPCYIVRKSICYDENGRETNEYEVVFPVCGLSTYEQKTQIPEFNSDGICENSHTTNYVTLDYEEALKECLKKNSQKVNRYGYGKIDWDSDFNLKEFSYEDYLTVIKDYQRKLDNLEPKKQVKRKIKTPANK